MSKRVKFVLYRKAWQDQILYNEKLGEICASKLGEGAVIERSPNVRGGGRIRARVYGSMSDEAVSGSLSRRIGGGS